MFSLMDMHVNWNTRCKIPPNPLCRYQKIQFSSVAKLSAFLPTVSISVTHIYMLFIYKSVDQQTGKCKIQNIPVIMITVHFHTRLTEDLKWRSYEIHRPC